MIFILKPATPPRVLLERGVEETSKNKALFEQNPQAFTTGGLSFKFKKSIYGHLSVKRALVVAQHKKCCFCERRTEVGDMEHYRSKGGWLQAEGDSPGMPGYWWLAYDWDNLLFACEKCNREFKRLFFPLANPVLRAVSHLHDLSLEEPLLIHPGRENPEDFIEYLGDAPRAKNGHPRGAATIKITGIDRPFLEEERRQMYSTAKSFFKMLQLPDLPAPVREELQAWLANAVKDTAPYASMMRCALRDDFRF